VTKRNDVERLAEELSAGGVSRREFVQRAMALGLSLGSIGALLTACQPKDKGVAQGGGDSTKAGAAMAELGPIEKELNIYNWSDYIAEDTVPNFEKEFGVKVTYDTYESNEEMVAKLQAGASGYDIVVPSGYIVPVLLATDLATPLSKQYLTNWKNIAPIFVNPVFDPDNAHSVPWQWGTTGFAYRKDKIKTPPESWAVFLDKQYKGKMTQMDDERDVIGSWLRYRGHSLNSTNPQELAAAKTDAVAAKKNLKAYISAPVKGQLISGDVWIAQLWNGDTAQAKVEQPNLEYVLPKEGCTIWADNLMIPRSAPHKRAAHEFMNYILRPEVGAGVSNTTGYGTPNAEALKLMKHPVPYPTPDEFARLEYQKDLGKDTALWDQIWTEIKSA
jgi:spermidine/putrescine transport system substrate-binding protein